MPVNFDWDFEQDDPSEQSEGFSTPLGRRRHWKLWAVTLCVLLLGGGLGARVWYDRRLARVEKIEAELRNVVQLELDDIRRGDAELFGLVQDPDPTAPRWRSQQVTRYITGPAGGFTPAPGLLPAPRPTEIEQVRVFGRLGRVKLRQWFYSTQPLSLPGSVLDRWFHGAVPLPFYVTWFYRLDEQGVWYHTPPPDSHVGAVYSWHGDWMDLYATKAESELLDGVVREVFALLYDACQLLDCPPDARYVLNLGDASAPQVYGSRWRLPSLYLTGQPQGQVARAAWLQAFELWIVEALARSRAGSDVQDSALYQRLVTRLQAQLGLLEPPAFDVVALTQALTTSEGYSLQYLWEAEYDPDDAQGNRLLEAKVDALLYWIEEQVGAERTCELLPALRHYRSLSVALRSLYLFPSVNLEQDWSIHLLNVTGLTSLPLPFPVTSYQALPEPPLPPPPSFLPGDQLAFICDGRVWVGNAAGSDLVPLTAAGQVFETLSWSPDGRWLLSAWRHSVEDNALYLLASDGSGARLLTDQPALGIYPIGWSPASSQALYYTMSDPGGRADMRATRLEGGDTRLLFNLPVWSPDGRWVASVQLSSDGNMDVWLADAAGTNSRKIVDQATLGAGAWSPDSSKLALALTDPGPTQGEQVPVRGGVVLYDLATGDLAPLITVAETTEIVSSSLQAASDGDFIGSGADPSILDNRPLQSLWPQGWSADGSRLVVRATQTSQATYANSPVSLVVAPLDSLPPRVLAFGQGGCYGRVTWSPTDPQRLLFAWPSGAPSGACYTYLFDLDAGPVYTATQGQVVAWSPDGEWLASARNGLTILDQQGRARFSPGEGDCSAVAWNPTANLSAPTRSITLTLGELGAGWSFDNVRFYQGRDHSLHAWGEVVNHSGRAQRVSSFLPLYIQNGDGGVIAFEVPFFLTPPHQDMFRSTSLNDGQSLPFHFELYLPDDARLVGAAQLVAQLDLDPASQELNREDLDISTEDLEMSGELDSLRVSGFWENPGPALDEYAVLVVTVYGRDGQALGWGWQGQTVPEQLDIGRHDFTIDIALADFALANWEHLSYYKVQLLAR